MGQPPDPPWPELEDNKFYKVTVDCYGPTDPPLGCAGPWVQSGSGCLQGWVIRSYIRTYHECTPTLLLFFLGGSNQRVSNLEGPFEDEAACLLAL